MGRIPVALLLDDSAGILSLPALYFNAQNDANTTAWWKFDEGEGTATESKSENAADGTAYTWDGDGKETGLIFDGVSDIANFGTDTAYLGSANNIFTWDAIMSFTDVTDSGHFWSKVDSNFADNDVSFSITLNPTGGTGRIGVRIRSGSTNSGWVISSGSDVADDTDYHVRVIYDGTDGTAANRLRVLVNGSVIANADPGFTGNLNNTTGDPLTFGARGDPNFHVPCKIKEAMISNGIARSNTIEGF